MRCPTCACRLSNNAAGAPKWDQEPTARYGCANADRQAVNALTRLRRRVGSRHPLRTAKIWPVASIAEAVMEAQTFRVLFLSQRNSARSMIAESLANSI